MPVNRVSFHQLKWSDGKVDHLVAHLDLFCQKLILQGI